MMAGPFGLEIGLEIGLEFQIMGSRPRHYRRCYVVPHGLGFKYLRAVPKDLQAIEHKQAWVKCLGVVSRREAETLAHALALRETDRGPPR